MLTPRPPIRTLLLLLAAPALPAQSPPAQSPPAQSSSAPAATAAATRKPRTPRPVRPLFNPNVIFLDPAHGGSDPGTTLAPPSGSAALEKDATLALAKTLRDLLTQRGFTVQLSHESAATPVPPPPRPAPDPNADPADPDTAQPAPPPFNPNANNPSLDARTEQANRSRALACLFLHATTAGHGVHVYTSALQPARPSSDPDPANRPISPWDTAQAASLPLSVRLASDLAGGLAGNHIPVVTGHISTRPIDSVSCPAVTLELAPLGSGDAATQPFDPTYQRRVAESLAAALDTWRTRIQPPASPAPSAPATAPTVPKPKPRPKVIVIPTENPITLTPAPTPAPIIRRPPAGNPATPPPGAPQ